MAETPDFDQIAGLLLDHLVEVLRGETGKQVAALRKDLFAPRVVEQLRLVWNARGAADLTKLESELSSMMGVTAAGPYVKNLDRALRALDR